MFNPNVWALGPNAMHMQAASTHLMPGMMSGEPQIALYNNQMASFSQQQQTAAIMMHSNHMPFAQLNHLQNEPYVNQFVANMPTVYAHQQQLNNKLIASQPHFPPPASKQTPIQVNNNLINDHLKSASSLQTNQKHDIDTNAASVKTDNSWINRLNPTQKSVLEQLNREQQEFELHFRNWEKEFENWRETNATHPDRTAYFSYSQMWEDWRNKLLTRREQMKQLHTHTMQQLYLQVNPTHENVTQPAPPPLPPPPPPPPPLSLPPPPPPPPKELPFPSFAKTPNDQQKISRNEPKCSKEEDTPKSKTANVSNSLTNESKTDIDSTSSHLCKNNNDNNSIIENKTHVENESESHQKKLETENSENTILSKAAETMIFIQKQQELLKTLENIEKIAEPNKDKVGNKESKDEIEITETKSKSFDLNDIVNKMKAIKPPETPVAQELTFAQQPSSAQRIIPQNNIGANYNQPQTSLSNVRAPHPPSQNYTQDPYKMYQRHHAPNFASNQPPYHSVQFPNSCYPQPAPSYNSWHPSISINREYPENNLKGINSLPNERMQSNQTNFSRKYFAQTIDYNHRAETNKPFYDHHHFNPPPSYSQPFEQILPPRRDNLPDMNFKNTNFNDIKKFQAPEIISYRDIRYFTEPTSGIVLIDDLLKPPSREFRPPNIIIILRGLPGSGKTYMAKMIKDKEIEFGGSAPRILSLDDYFMVEKEENNKDKETGKRTSLKEYVYEYEHDMEHSYRTSMLKSFKKTIDDGLFPFIIVDSVNEVISYFEDFYNYAIQHGFAVFVAEMECTDPSICHKRNVHNRKIEELRVIARRWEKTPNSIIRLDTRSFLQNSAIQEVDMESSQSGIKRKCDDEKQHPNKQSSYSSDDANAIENCEAQLNSQVSLSRWEKMDATDSRLDRLDSFKMKTKLTIEEYLQVTEDYESRQGQKRVRWADIEEQKKQVHMRQIGFVVGVDWQSVMDPEHCERALTKTKYI